MPVFLATRRIVMLAVLSAVAVSQSRAVGQMISQNESPPVASGPTWEQFNDVVARLESEIHSLRDQRAEPPTSTTAAPNATLTDTYRVRPTDYLESITHGKTCSGCDECADTCPDCGKPASPAAPHVCGFTLEELSWNKAGGWRVVPFGRVRGELIYSGAPYTNDVIVAFLNPNNPGVDEDVATVSAKQSQLNFAITGPTYCGWQTGGLILMNFMGAQPLRNFSGANIVNAYGEFKNDDWRFSFGRMVDLFGPINPTTVNQIQQRGAGNIGIYRGALSVDRYLTYGDVQRWTISARVSQQDISDFASVPVVRGQDNGWPNVEARLGVELGSVCDYGRPLEIGLSGLVGETQAVVDQAILGGIIFPAIDDVAQTRGACLDVQLRGPTFGFRGEVWWATAAGTYFVATLQSLNPETAQAIESLGGWGEIYYNINSCMTTHVGFGVDDPRNADLGFIDRMNVGIGQISYNEVGWWNIIWNVTDYFELSTEVSHRRTRYIAADAANDGTQIHFASTLNF